MAARKTPAPPKPPKAAPLPIPDHVEAAWAKVKNKEMQQLFHPAPAKRLAAVAKLMAAFNFYEDRGQLLVGAALAEPDPGVQAAMLGGVAGTGRYLGWQDALRLKAALASLGHQPAVRRELARCAAVIPLTLDATDLPWLGELLSQQQHASDALDEPLVRAVVACLSRMAARDVPGALTAFGGALRLPRIGTLAFYAKDQLGAALNATALELLEAGGEHALHAAQHLGLQGPAAASPAARAALLALAARGGDDALDFALLAGLLEPATLPSLLDQHHEELAVTDTNRPHHGLFMEALSWCPAQAARYVEPWGRHNLSGPGVSEACKRRWVEGNPELVSKAIEGQLADVMNGRELARWWMVLHPRDGQAALVAAMKSVVAGNPRGQFTFQEQELLAACCVELERHPVASSDVRAVLGAMAARQVDHLTSSWLPTVRALHACGAQATDLQPAVDAMLKKASAAKAKGDAVAAATREALARLMVALRSLAELERRWEDVELVWSAGYYCCDVVELLGPFLADARVRALIQAGVSHPRADVQRCCAQALGLMDQSP